LVSIKNQFLCMLKSVYCWCRSTVHHQTVKHVLSSGDFLSALKQSRVTPLL